MSYARFTKEQTASRYHPAIEHFTKALERKKYRMSQRALGKLAAESKKKLKSGG